MKSARFTIDRAHHSITLALATAVTTIGMTALLGACGSDAAPAPRYVQVRADAYVAVPFMPRPPPIEIVPPRPASTSSDLVWADGGWQWSGERFRWDPGSWVAPPPGAKRARWVVVRRVVDGQLFFAPSSWRDGNDQPIDPPTPLARAISRPGGASGATDGRTGLPGAGGLDE